MKGLEQKLRKLSVSKKASSKEDEKYNPKDPKNLGEKSNPIPFFDMTKPMGFTYTPPPGKRIRPIMEVILFGLKDKNSPLSIFGGASWRHLVRYIVDMSGADNDGSIWTISGPPSQANPALRTYKSKNYVSISNTLYYSRFPQPQGIQINMMPFVIGDKESIPEEYHGYWNMLCACPVDDDNIGKVGYLTIHESLVPAGQSQRRNGLHVEAPGRLTGKIGIQTREKYVRAAFGGGHMVKEDKMVGGIFMASTIEGTCQIFDACVDDPNVAVRDDQCSLEHVRHLFGKGYMLKKGEIVWMSDKTPHEALPQPVEEPRQFFRLVTSDLTVWFSKRCTPNRLGIVPPPDVFISDYEDLGGSRSKLWREYLAVKERKIEATLNTVAGLREELKTLEGTHNAKRRKEVKAKIRELEAGVAEEKREQQKDNGGSSSAEAQKSGGKSFLPSLA